MDKRGICIQCGKERYVSAGNVCRVCNYQRGICYKCGRHSKIYVKGTCYLCYQHQQVLKRIVELEESFTAYNTYNHYLFQLYLTYIKRYRLSYVHLRQSKGLVQILATQEIEVIKCWNDIYKKCVGFAQLNDSIKKPRNPFNKIGFMLTELGVLSPPEEEVDRQLENMMKKLRYEAVDSFVSILKKTNRSDKTIVRVIHLLTKLEERLNEKEQNIMTVSDHLLLEYFNEIKNYKLQHKRKIYHTLRKFYNWCRQNNYLKKSPLSKIIFTRPASKISICSEEQFLLLKKYIRNEDSDPEAALFLSLILFWGFRTLELAQAQLITEPNGILIKFRRIKISKGKRYYNRPEILKLPTEPAWFLNLQKRFLDNWQTHYAKVKKTYPSTPLVLSRSCHANRYLNTDTVRSRIQVTVKKVCGVKIPLRVLRQTCGHLYAQNADTSILPTIGWSAQFAFHYNWMPRVTYTDE